MNALLAQLDAAVNDMVVCWGEYSSELTATGNDTAVSVLCARQAYDVAVASYHKTLETVQLGGTQYRKRNHIHRTGTSVSCPRSRLKRQNRAQ